MSDDADSCTSGVGGTLVWDEKEVERESEREAEVVGPRAVSVLSTSSSGSERERDTSTSRSSEAESTFGVSVAEMGKRAGAMPEYWYTEDSDGQVSYKRTALGEYLYKEMMEAYPN
ncbi:hypothetical protein KIPB_012954, partial [Kipferlia bialata]|eukprot:g12954.t1